MSRLVVPVEYVLAAVPWAELVTDRDGTSRIVNGGDGYTVLPVVEVEEGEAEWPEIIIPR